MRSLTPVCRCRLHHVGYKLHRQHSSDCRTLVWHGRSRSVAQSVSGELRRLVLEQRSLTSELCRFHKPIKNALKGLTKTNEVAARVRNPRVPGVAQSHEDFMTEIKKLERVQFWAWAFTFFVSFSNIGSFVAGFLRRVAPRCGPSATEQSTAWRFATSCCSVTILGRLVNWRCLYS